MSTKMSKLSFRAKPLDASKPMPVYINEELPGLPDYSAINRAVPQMPSGMHKEEECEHHLQRAICTGLIIPTPECTDVSDEVAYDRLYPSNFKTPRQLIHMQSFAMDQDIPDYDMDSEDELWFSSQKSKLKISPEKFEEMMDRLEKGLGQTVLSEQQAKALLKDDDDVILAVYDYWLNKRLKTQYPLIPAVRTEHHPGTAPDNPYIAFRRRTEKMQTRKHRKNDETSYEKMLKLKRDLSRAVTLLELIKRREKTKREVLHLTVEVFEKRYQAGDFSGQMLAEVSTVKPCPRPAFAPLFPNQFSVNHQNWPPKEEPLPRKEKRPYKKRKHKAPLSAAGALGSNTGVPGRTSVSSTASVTAGLNASGIGTESLDLEGISSDDGEVSPGLLSGAAVSDDDDSGADGEGPFVFRRRKNCSYHAPLAQGQGNWPWCSREEGGLADRRYRFCLTSLATPPPGRCVGFSRRRVGRGGRVVLDRVATPMDDLFRSLDFTIFDSGREYKRPRPMKRYKRPVRRVSQGKTIKIYPQTSEPTPQEAEKPSVSAEQPNQQIENEITVVKDDGSRFKSRQVEDEITILKDDRSRFKSEPIEDEITVVKDDRPRFKSRPIDDEITVVKDDRSRFKSQPIKDDVTVVKDDGSRFKSHPIDDEITVVKDDRSRYKSLPIEDEVTIVNDDGSRFRSQEVRDGITVKDDGSRLKFQRKEPSNIEEKKINDSAVKTTHKVTSATRVDGKSHSYERYQNVSGTESQTSYERYSTSEQQYQISNGTEQVTETTYERYTSDLPNANPDQGPSQEPTEPTPGMQMFEELDNEFLNEVRSEWLHFRPMSATNSTDVAATSGDPEPVFDWNTSTPVIDFNNLRFDIESPDGGPPTEMTFFDLLCNMPAPVDPSFFGFPSEFEIASRWGAPDLSDLIREDAGTSTGRQNPLTGQSNPEAGCSSSSAVVPKPSETDDDKYQVGCSKFIVHSGPKPSPPQLWANISSSLHQAPGPGRPGGTTSTRTAHQHRKRERHHQHSQSYSFYNSAGTTSSSSNPPLSNGVSIIPVSVSAVLSANPGLLRQGLSNGPAGPSSGTVVSSSSRRRAIPVFIKQEVVEEATDLNEQFNCVSFGSGCGPAPGESTAAGICVSPATADSSSPVAAAAAAAAAAACSEQQKLKSSTTSQQQVLMEVT